MRRPIIGQFPPASWYWNQIQTRSWPYRYAPDAPTGGTDVSYAQTTSGTINTTIAGVNRLFRLVGTWQRVTLSALNDSVPYVFVNKDGTTRIGTGIAAGGISSLTTSNNAEFYSKSLTEPFIVELNGNGIQFLPTGGDGTKLKVIGLIFRDITGAGILINTNSSGLNYGDSEFAFNKITRVGVEGGYQGTTLQGATPVTYWIGFTNIHDNGVYDANWDGWQIAGMLDFSFKNNTLHNVGQTAVGGEAVHTHLWQCANSNGIVENNIFDGARELWNCTEHGVTYRNNYWRWDGDKAEPFGYNGDLETVYDSPLTANGEPILHVNEIFDPVNAVSFLNRVANRGANHEFRDCIFNEKIAALYQDFRGALPTNTLTGGLTSNGNSIVNSADIIKPEYKSTNELDPDFLQCITPYFLNRGMGKGT